MSYPRQSILFISGLDKSVNENQLYQLFHEFPISYIKIAKDHKSRESYGYAFVGFKSHSKAEEALIKLNYSKVANKTIRISWYNREPNNFRAHPEYNIFIKKLNKKVNGKEFHDYFSKFGNIISAKLVEDDEGEVLGYGFVLYDNLESSSTAVSDGNGAIWKDKPIYVGKFEKNRPKKAPKFNTVYVKNLPKEYKEEEVKEIFSGYGEILSIFMKSTDSKLVEKLSEGKKKSILEHQFAFITFKDFNSASKVVDQHPYLRLNDENYNSQIRSLANTIEKNGFFDNRFFIIYHSNSFKFACYLLENIENYNEVLSENNNATDLVYRFRHLLSENDNIYLIKDKNDHIDCYQALKKKDRIKKLKSLYEKIKRQIREKYKFCNLYVKNLPDGFDEEAFRQLFEKYGRIRSCKTVNKDELSYLGITRSVKIFGFVCFFDSEQARCAKKDLHDKEIKPRIKLFVDYHQSKKEREEILKLKMLNQSQKIMQNEIISSPTYFQDLPYPGMIRDLKNFQGNFVGKQMLRKFHLNTSFPTIPQFRGMGINNNNFMGSNYEIMRNIAPNMDPMQSMKKISKNSLLVDKNTRSEFFGERLYNKISSNNNFSKFNSYFSKVVGIFLDLEDEIIMKLINDDHYFNTQVAETIKQLIEKSN